MKTRKCTNCGKCCKEEICEIGKVAFVKVRPPCPALISSGNKHLCNLVVYEEKYFKERYISDALGIGKGCDNSKYVGFINDTMKTKKEQGCSSPSQNKSS